MIRRRESKPIYIGSVQVGGDAPVSVQSMTKTDTRDVKATVAQIRELEGVGCEIIRLAVPDMEAAKVLSDIKRQINIPLIADIHFDYRLALESIAQGVDGLRLNPGNIRDEDKVRLIVAQAKERQIPIRIGVNFGSLPPVGRIGKTGGASRVADGVNQLAKAGDAPEGEYTVVDHMVDTALWEIRVLEEMDFDLIKLSLKAFDVPTCVETYRRIAGLVPYALHVGITEAGTVRAGSIRNAVGIGVLLYEGIGDTIRVSLSGPPTDEVRAGYDILKSLNLREKGVTLIACPTCGRADVDVVALAAQVEKLLDDMNRPIKVAVMGCEVNGPGEAKDADVGIAAGVGRGIIFRKGQKVRTVPEGEMLAALMEEIEKVQSASGRGEHTP
jgi:(E)-4-hydroxy-3-methylbut-2-enyl-diphosphate synthase